MKKIRLGVNIDHVATIRNARNNLYPDPIYAAFIAENSGADGITIHIRKDERHILKRDAKILRKTIQTKMNLEMANTKNMLKIAELIHPDFCCIVPENRKEITTERGIDLKEERNSVKDSILFLQKNNIKVSLFIDPDINQVYIAKELKANCIELHTGFYANAKCEKQKTEEIKKIQNCAKIAKKIGLSVHAGHGLDYYNVQEISSILEIEELNIGHSIISRAFFVGISKAVQEMKKLIEISRK
ncbi:pyridoxine 5'-phosphate synthase [bacterium endosymbiont of Pedicinus badii]|uniref:pyridoxine 5'-phosphate synthase n=1 Tax=bacterium endosymbiont of Pedicinus badii TaxID=1719126 RepID=UPI0009BC3081|nr:pyridoxine 5'-phosphate synthase [bacterium endosymbiont of Pedicinus badii]OQM34493.1 pyridoxine 5'-phosphate synthase [bacterium endosymbiont of Pedicinus badii]